MINKALIILVSLTIFSIVFGVLGKIPLNIAPISVYLTDIFAGLLAVIFLIKIKFNIKRLWKIKSIQFASIFILIAIASLLLTPINLSVYEKFISSLYLIRFTAYFLTFPCLLFLIKEKHITVGYLTKLLMTVGIILIIIGWLQYFLYPDLRNLYYLGWDPHYFRIFGSFFDPNYFGLMQVLFITLLISGKINKISLISLFASLVSLAFTYSRSSFLSLAASLSYFSIIKKKYLYFLVLFMFISGLVLLPRPGGAGVELERLFSIEQRIENWKDTASIFIKHPLTGVGFNTLRYVRRNYQFLSEDWLTSHSAAGVDNSFLYVAVTTGILGLIIYVKMLFSAFQEVKLLGKLTTIAVIIHSLFLNTLFYPFVMIFLFTVWAIDYQGE